jgi:spore germination protein YaaH
MRLPVFVGAGAMTTGMLLLGGLLATELNPMPVVNVDAMELDGASVLSAPLAQVSPRPQLAVRVSRPLEPDDWHLAIDGHPVALSATQRGAVLRVKIPGPLPLGSRHTMQLRAGTMQIRAAFQVVPPLSAAISMHLYHLQADSQVSVAATISFSRAVADRAQAQAHLTVSGKPTFTWRDAQTVDVVSTGFGLSDHAVVMIDPGIDAADGTRSRKFQSSGLSIPSTLTQVVPGHMVQMYYVNTDDGRASLFAHMGQIDVLSPAWYDANANGSITGYARRDVIDAAHANHVAIIPLVVNKDVDPGVGHAILADPNHRAALCSNLVNEAKTSGYAGFQLDLEQILWTDRDLLTELVRDCAAAFHPAGLNLSIAVIPRLPGDDSATGSLLNYFRQWSGAYDFAALAKSADFLSFMTYDEHNGVTPPGAVSGTPWMRRALDFSMQGVPPEKAALGLPTYYHDWTGVGRLTSSSYADAMILAQQHGVTPAYDATEEEMHFGYDAYGVHHELWIQSTDTLRRKLPLMYEYGLKGISVWRLGFEDPSFWSLIPPRR